MTVNAEMLVLGRESRRLTQSELAEKLGVRQATISKSEAGVLGVSDAFLADLSRELRYPPSFFRQQDSIRGFESPCLYHRKRKSIPSTDLKAVHAIVNILRMQASRLLRGAEFVPANEFPRLDLDEFGGSPDVIAQRVRAAWKLPRGPVKNVVAMIEAAGGLVFSFSFGTKQIDAVSQWVPGLPPMFFVNSDMHAGDRMRLTLAHEIGHLVMNNATSTDPEQEANKFAAEFLMPAREIGADLSRMSISKAASLKPYWKTSMQAIVRRAHDLEAISTRTYRWIFTEISKLNYRMDEPLPIEPEEPSLIDALVRVHMEDFGFGIDEICSFLNCYQEDFVFH